MNDKFKSAKCCSCSESMAQSPHINLVTLNYRADWEYPVSGNVLTGEKFDRAVAVVCDACIEDEKPDIQFAIETDSEAFIYHPVAELTEAVARKKAQMTDRDMLESLDGTVCASCGGKKKSMMSHCRKCYYDLPPEMRRRLYQRFDNGYQSAFLASLDYLEENRNGK